MSLVLGVSFLGKHLFCTHVDDFLALLQGNCNTTRDLFQIPFASGIEIVRRKLLMHVVAHKNVLVVSH